MTKAPAPAFCRCSKKGDLLLRDLGYFVLRVLQQLSARQVHVLRRLRYDVKLSDWWGREIALSELLKKRKGVDRRVYVEKKHKVRVRLVLIPLPKRPAAARIRKAKADPHRRFHHSQAYYQWLRYSVFIATVGKDTRSTQEVAKAYGVRWQIAIIFKSWKSGFRMQALLHEQCTEEHRVKTRIHPLLLFIALFMQKVCRRYGQEVERQTGNAVSLLKRSALFFSNRVELRSLGPQKLKQQISWYACYEKRNHRINMTELMHAF